MELEALRKDMVAAMKAKDKVTKEAVSALIAAVKKKLPLMRDAVMTSKEDRHKAGAGNQCTCQQRHGTGFKGIAGRFSAFPAF